MNSKRGIVKQIKSKTFSWSVADINYEELKNSGFFYDLESSQQFCLSFHVLDKKTLSREFYLCEKFKDEPNIYDVIISLKYIDKEEVFVIGNVKPVKQIGHLFYNLKAIKTDNLLKITCTFLERNGTSETIFETGKKEFIEKQNEISESLDETTCTEQRKAMKGEIALLESIKGLFLNEEESDFSFKVGAQIYPAHKNIIRARSPVFYAMFKHDMKEKQDGAVDIEDCDSKIFREFLLYLYSGKLDNITEDNMFELYYMSDKYDVKEMRMECVDFIGNHLTVETICDAISLSSKHSENDMLHQATTFFINNVHDIVTTVNWQKFHKENPTEANELFIKTVNQKIAKKKLE